MWRFVLTVLVGTALLSSAGLVLALQCVRLIEKIEHQAGMRFNPVAADAAAAADRTRETGHAEPVTATR